ncbi:MAG TPA: serine/threonine-protein kinase [Polyangia bacterium]|nr:serine/threonine-protein kinase [Polyangia bacterium]
MTEKTIGNYRLLRPLGEGGMGVVYEAVHASMHRRAAVKVLRPELSRNQEVIRRFFNEARATNEIRHPGIVQIYDCGTMSDGSPWLIMELLEGETLSALLARRERLPAAEVIDLGAQAASVLAAAHAAGIVHRDLKPDNLFVVPDPGVPGGRRVKVLDFGIAKLGSLAAAGGMRTQTGMLMGTPVYMSPEQCRGNKEIDGRSDVYSLGLILYQMVTGRPPFTSDGLGELFDMHMNRPAPPLDGDSPDVGPALAAVIHQALEKKPADRFASMGNLQKALLAAATGPAVPASPETPQPWKAPSETRVFGSGPTTLSASASALEVVTDDVPRRRAGPAIAAATVFVALAGGGLWLYGRGGQRPPSPSSARDPVAAPAAEPPRPAAVVAPPSTAPAPGPAKAPPNRAPDDVGAVVGVAIDSAPPGARVVDADDGRLLGLTPLHTRLPRRDGELKVRIEKRGYLPRALSLPLQKDGASTVRLEKNPAGATPRPGGEEHIIKL